MSKGKILWEGLSPVDGQPIVAIAIPQSGNTKTGNMVQTYILLRDIDPRDASKSGADAAICGDCPHRGTPTDDPGRKIAANRRCYVNLGQGPLVVWRAYRRGAYKRGTVTELRDMMRGRMLRIGTYGDPAFVPGTVWGALRSWAAGHTAYSHSPGSDGFDADSMMHSADSLADAQEAWKKGHRTFRVLGQGETLTDDEIVCPASSEGGRAATCATCKLCAGASVNAPSIAIRDHGPQRKRA